MIPETMWAARLHAPGEELRLERVPVPRCGPGEVLVKVAACGICGSDLHIIDGSTPLPVYPRILGHEIAGTVVAAGEHADPWQPGDRVCVDFLVTCGECYYCRAGRESLCSRRQGLGIHLDGGFAEFVKVPARNLLRLPENVCFEWGALVTDAVATPFHAVTKRCRIGLGDTVALFGMGGIGLHALLLVRMCGAGWIAAVDNSASALALAREWGADAVVDASLTDAVAEIRHLTGGTGVHVALEMVGKPETILQAVEVVRPGGRAVIVGLGDHPMRLPPPGVFVRNEVEVVGSYAFERGEIAGLLELVASGRLDLSRSVTRVVPLTQIGRGVEDLLRRKEAIVRIVVKP